MVQAKKKQAIYCLPHSTNVPPAVILVADTGLQLNLDPLWPLHCDAWCCVAGCWCWGSSSAFRR